MATRCDIEAQLVDALNERSELRQRIEELDRVELEFLALLDGFCKRTCDHGHGCALPRHHEPADRHESTCNQCVFWDQPQIGPRR